MYVYNITIKVQSSIANEWVVWQKEVHIPEIMATGLFNDYKFYQLLEQDESDGQTFVTQFFASTIDEYDQYINVYSGPLREKAFSKWGDKFIGFRSLLASVQ